MDIVADTNIFLAVALDEPEKTNIIRLTSGSEIFSPEILPYEIGNALSAMIKREKITRKEALSALNKTNSIPVRLISVDLHQALKLAMKFNIYAYDAYFLQGAITLSRPLITLDKQMRQVANELNIELVG